MSERMLGLTVISLGTAMPELIGSGRRGVARPLEPRDRLGDRVEPPQRLPGARDHRVPAPDPPRRTDAYVVDLVGLVAITLLGVVMLRGSRRISRFEGVLLIAAYVTFIVACTWW